MEILLVNDDGYFANGIVALANILSKKHNVTVVAPDRCYSGSSHAMTFYKKIKVEKIDKYDWKCYSVGASPVDCVMLAVKSNICANPDIILSGINNLYNVGTDVIYSGTVHAAMEGTLLGFKSIAVSTETESLENFSCISNFIASNFKKLFALTSCDYTLNINIPKEIINCLDNKIDNILSVSSIGYTKYSNRYKYTYNENGEIDSYTLIGDFLEVPNCDSSDVVRLKNKLITLSAILPRFKSDNKVLEQNFNTIFKKENTNNL